MLSKIPPQAKPIIAVVCLIAAAIIIWQAISNRPQAALGPIVINLDNGRVYKMSHNSYQNYAAKAGSNRRIFPVEPDGTGGLRIHYRLRGDFIGMIENFGMTKEGVSQYLDFSDPSWPRVKEERVPEWAKKESAESPAPAPPPSNDSRSD